MTDDRYAVVDEDGLVDNVVLWDGAADWSPPQGRTAVEVAPQVDAGWRLDGEVWLTPEEAL